MSPRRQQVIELRSQRLSTRAIAQTLGISQPMVIKHLRRAGLSRPHPALKATPSGVDTPPPHEPLPVRSVSMWAEARLDTVLMAAFAHGLRCVRHRDGLVLDKPPGFPSSLWTALVTRESELLFLINRAPLTQ